MLCKEFEAIENKDNLVIKGSLDIRGSGIKKLPDNLTINGDLLAENTALKSYQKT